MPVALENDTLRLIVDPAAGASILALHVRHGQSWLPLMPDSRDPACDLVTACFIMAPYSNRIRDGAFPFQGHTLQLERSDAHAIHGDVRTRCWNVIERTDVMVRCQLDTTIQDQVNWPWPFILDAVYSLDGDTLIARLELTNTAAEPAPAGFGWHPYFRRWLTRPGEPVMLRFGVERAFPDACGTRLPSGPAAVLPPDQDFRCVRELKPEHFLDTCFTGYDGNGGVDWPESGIGLRWSCSASCTHLVVYNPAGKPYFAFEPVTNANNGMNLYAAGDPDSGVRVLDPGESMDARFATQVRTET